MSQTEIFEKITNVPFLSSYNTYSCSKISKNHHDIACSFSERVRPIVFCHFGLFLRNPKIFVLGYQKLQLYQLQFLKYSADKLFPHFWPLLPILPHLWPKKSKFSKNKKCQERLSFYINKNHDHTMYSSWATAHDRRTDGKNHYTEKITKRGFT